MKSTRLISLLLLAGLGLLALPTVHAQALAPAVTAPIPEDAQNFILGLLFTLAAKYPVLATVITVLGSFRLWAKPLFSALHALVEITPSQYDDGLWATGFKFFTEHPIGKTLAWLLDYIGSVKITPPKPKAD